MRLVPELVAGMPFGLSPSRVQLTAAVEAAMTALLGRRLSDAEERELRRLVTYIVRAPWPADVEGRYRLARGYPDLVDWGRRWGEFEGGPIVVGDVTRWAGRPVSDVVEVLKPRLDHGTTDDRRKLLEDQLEQALRDLGFEVGSWKPGFGSDLWVQVEGIPINLECRNRVWEVLNGLEDRDRKIFPEVAAEGLPSVVVTAAATHRYDQSVERWTSGLGSVIRIGCCVVRNDQVVANLREWSPWSLVTRLPDVAVYAVADELERVADRLRGAESLHVASNVVETGSRVSWSEAARLVGDGADGGDTGAVVLPFQRRVRLSDADLVGAAREYRASHPGCRQREAAEVLGVGYDRLRDAWRREAGERWSWAVDAGQ